MLTSIVWIWTWIMVLTSCFLFIAEDGKEGVNSDAPENNPQYTTVYVGNLSPEARVFASSFIIVNIIVLISHLYLAVVLNWRTKTILFNLVS